MLSAGRTVVLVAFRGRISALGRGNLQMSCLRWTLKMGYFQVEGYIRLTFDYIVINCKNANELLTKTLKYLHRNSTRKSRQ